MGASRFLPQVRLVDELLGMLQVSMKVALDTCGCYLLPASVPIVLSIGATDRPGVCTDLTEWC